MPAGARRRMKVGRGGELSEQPVRANLITSQNSVARPSASPKVRPLNSHAHRKKYLSISSLRAFFAKQSRSLEIASRENAAMTPVVRKKSGHAKTITLLMPRYSAPSLNALSASSIVTVRVINPVTSSDPSLKLPTARLK